MPERLARPLAMLVAVLGVLLLLGAALSSEVQPDADAYWLAALRLRAGQPLYLGGTDETEIFRYAPWFALAWVPLTQLPQEVAYGLWRALLAISTLAAVWPLVRRPTPAALTLSILLGGLLLTNLPAANVTPLMAGLLSLGLATRAGPVVVGVTASLKVFPLVFVLGYLAERRPWAAVASMAVAAVLWLGVLAFDPARYLSLGGPSFYAGGVSLFGVSLFLWVPVAIGIALVTGLLALAGSRWTWLSAAAAIPLAVPRVWLPDAAFLLPGAAAVLRTGGRRSHEGTDA
jgi:hypothetical protein